MTREQDTAKKIVQILEHGTSDLDAATIERLAAARKRAVAAMPHAAHNTQAVPAYAGSGHHTLLEYLREHHLSWAPALLGLLAALLVFTLWQQNSNKEPVATDTLLLASDLPPAAYVDQGFDAWLENSSRD